MRRVFFSSVVFLSLFVSQCWPQTALVFLTDYGLKDGAVACMKGVAFGVNPNLKMFDVTHEIPISTSGRRRIN
jgi:hypothetical protein